MYHKFLQKINLSKLKVENQIICKRLFQAWFLNFYYKKTQIIYHHFCQ